MTLSFICRGSWMSYTHLEAIALNIVVGMKAYTVSCLELAIVKYP